MIPEIYGDRKRTLFMICCHVLTVCVNHYIMYRNICTELKSFLDERVYADSLFVLLI